MDGVDPVDHCILARARKLVKAIDLGASGVVDIVPTGMFDNSAGITKTTAIREARQTHSADAGNGADGQLRLEVARN